LLERYDGFLLDAYGVLVNSESTLPGANRFLQRLRQAGKPFRLISNDGSTTPEAKSAKWARRGLTVEAEYLLTPWSVLASSFSPLDLSGKACHLIGTTLSAEMLRRAGGHLTDEAEELDIFILADEMTPDFMKACDRALSLIVEAHRAGREPRLVVVNPDLVYPSAGGYGFTAGAICRMFEAGLERILGEPTTFLRIGKPGPELFELGVEQLGMSKQRVAMLGDQWETDIEGASGAGVDSVLVATGIGLKEDASGEQMVLEDLLS
jgi:HAD superfamily hydrolase (TIGR01450 family)